MALATVRVILPIGSPLLTGTLCKSIVDKHVLLGANSPLTGFLDMTAFGTKTTNANALQLAGDTNQKKAQSKYNVLEKHCGLANGQNSQTPGTVYNYIILIRDVLLLKYRGAEEQLTDWGFNVVLSTANGRSYVRVDMPDVPAMLLGLAGEINGQHTTLGASSPIPTDEINMTTFGDLVTDGNLLLGEYTSADALAQSKHNQALVIYGYGNGQTSKTEGTLYYDLCVVRDRLKLKYKGAEEQMSEWGFEVILGKHKPGKKKGKTVLAILEGNVGIGTIINVALPDVETQPTDIADFEAFLSVMRIFFSATPGEIPGPATAFFDVQPGTKVSKTMQQLMTELGWGDAKPHMNVQNVGMTPGNYKITVRIG